MNIYQALSIIIPAIAVLVSPLFALLFTNISNKKHKVLADRDLCCLTPRMYNADPANVAYVNALNSVPLVFRDQESILLKWKETIEHLNKNTEENGDWEKTYLRLRCKLISEISTKTSYGKINDNDIQNESYVPKKFSENEKLLTSIPDSFNRMASALEEQINLTKGFYASVIALNTKPSQSSVSNNPSQSANNTHVGTTEYHS